MGSVTPLLAVVAELRRRNSHLEVTWFGTRFGPERTLIEAQGIAFQPIAAGKLRRYLSLENLFDVLRVAGGFCQSFWWFGQHEVGAVLVAGSFVGVPVGWAAWLWRVPVLVHQQDVKPSLANKLLAGLATRITVAFHVSRKYFPPQRTVYTGNPVRVEFLSPPTLVTARQRLGLDPRLSVVALIGGGTGSRGLNELMASSLAGLAEFAQIVHVTGLGKRVAVSDDGRYRQFDFTLDTLAVLQAADLVITRAGLGTLTELAALGKAALVVPLPGTHQEENAALLAAHSAAEVRAQPSLTSRELVVTVRRLLADEAHRVALGRNLAQLFPKHATQAISDEVEGIIRSKIQAKL